MPRYLAPACRHGVVDLLLHVPHDLGGLVVVAGRLADLLDLLVGGAQGGDGRLDQHRDAELAEPAHQAARVLRGDDEGRVVLGDRLDVRGEAGQAGHRHPGRVVGVLVDGDDLGPGADRVQVLGRGRVERDDPVRLALDRHAAVGGGHGWSGKTGTRIDFGVGGGRRGGRLAAVALLADEQPASAAAAATAASTAAESRWGVLIECYFLRYERGGRRDRRPAGSEGSRRTGRSALPTRVDVVPRSLSRPGLYPAEGGIITVAGQRRNGHTGFTGFAP